MPKKEILKPKGSLFKYTTIEKDRRRIDGRLKRKMLFELLIIREFETKLLELKDLGLVHGPVHSSIGQEGVAVGIMTALDTEDVIASTHRGHHHFLAKAFSVYAGPYDPLHRIPDSIIDILSKTFSEILGLKTGYCRGRGGSMHLADRNCNFIGTNAIVAGGVSILTGAAWAYKLNNHKKIGVSFLGDGAVNQGIVHEVMNMAALWSLPVVYVIENNMYAVATHVNESSSLEHLAQRCLGYGLQGMVVDGMDPLGVYLAMQYARKEAIQTSPIVLEVKTYRYKHQAQGLPGSSFGYRTKEEEEEWMKRDPLQRFPEELLKEGILQLKDLAYLKEIASSLISQSISIILQTQKGSYYIPQELYPDKEDLKRWVLSNGKELQAIKYAEPEEFLTMENRKFIDVIPEVLCRCLDVHEEAYIIGEEVGKMKGGAFLATKGIYQKHPARVINTPISEAGFTGMALGLALVGKRPIVEIMYPDFALAAADPLFNQIGKYRYMFGNQFDAPLIIRTRVSIGTGYGAQHSMEPTSLFALFPGWRIVAPSNPFDYAGLFNTAFRSLDPVLIIEHQALYPMEGPVPRELDYFVPFGKARVIKKGTSLTVVSYSFGTIKALRAAEILSSEGINVEVIDLRTVDYASIDYKTIGESLKKTGNLLIVEEAPFLGGIGAQISDEVQRRFFDFLDSEIHRIAGIPIPMPVSKALETLAIPNEMDIAQEIRQMMQSAWK